MLRTDVRGEEDELLPRLRQVADARTLRRVGLAWEAVRRTAPTRAHPVVSRRPPGNALAAVPLSLLDRTRDGLDRASRLAPPAAARRLQSGSDELAGVAGRVEPAAAPRGAG